MQTVTSRDGTSIAFDPVGDGPALILVNGALSDRQAGTALAAQLAPRYRVYCYDRRGRGDSGDTLPYAVAREVEDLAAVLAAAGGAAFVFGHSSGAALALEAAFSLPITRLAVYEPPFIVDATRAPLPADYVAHLDELVAAGQRGQAVEYFMREAVGVPEAMIAQMKQSEPWWTQMQRSAQTIAYDGQVMGSTMRGSPQPLQRYAALTLPILVMDGGASETWAHHGAQALAEVLPRAQRKTLPGQTHGATPESLAPVLEEFFAGA